MSDLLITKPQFDTDKLRSGTAIMVKNVKESGSVWFGFKRPCIITRSEPLELRLAYVREDPRTVGSYDEDEGKKKLPIYSLEEKLLPIEMVASGRISITLLTEQKAEKEAGF